MVRLAGYAGGGLLTSLLQLLLLALCVPASMTMLSLGCAGRCFCSGWRLLLAVSRRARGRPFLTVFVLFLLSGFCLEGNVKRKSTAEDVERIDMRRAELDKRSYDERMALFNEHLQMLEACPIVHAASAQKPKNARNSKPNDFGVRHMPLLAG